MTHIQSSVFPPPFLDLNVFWDFFVFQRQWPVCKYTYAAIRSSAGTDSKSSGLMASEGWNQDQLDALRTAHDVAHVSMTPLLLKKSS